MSIGFSNTGIADPTEINWSMATLALVVIVIYYLFKRINKSRKLQKMGMGTRNLLLFGNLKNCINGMEEEKRMIYETLFHKIIMAEKTTNEIQALKDATEDLQIENLKEDPKIETEADLKEFQDQSIKTIKN